MNSVKVKNFIILVLLLVNAVLLSVFVTDYARERELAGAAVEGAAALLEENGISVSPDADPQLPQPRCADRDAQAA